MLLFFACAARPQEAADLLIAYPRDPWVLLYGITWMSYFGWSMCTATRLSWKWSKRPGPHLLRLGLSLISVGTGIGILYTLHRAGMLATSYFRVRLISHEIDSAINALLAVIPLVLITTGTTLPAYDKLHRVIRDQRDLVALYRLWRELTDAVPNVRLGSLRSPLIDTLDVRANRSRLYRRTIEIRDAILILSDHAPSDLRAEALNHAARAGLTTPAREHAAEACWIRAARQARVAGVVPTGVSVPPVTGGEDLSSEITALRVMSKIYFSPLASQFATSAAQPQIQSWCQEPCSMSTFTPPEPPSFKSASRAEKVARVITEVLAPANLVIALLLFIGWHSTRGWAGLGWGLLAALFCGVIPISVVLLGVRRGDLTDKHIRIRGQRVVPMAASMLSVVAGVALLYVLGAPRDVSALVVAMLVGLISSMAVTVWWQISIHNSVAGGTAMILILALGPTMIPFFGIAAAVGWSRLTLKAHTLTQVLAGTALGSVAATTFAILR
jgi:membrane-associated phospholipid phosphatase